MSDDFRGVMVTFIGIGAAVVGWTVNEVVKLGKQVAKLMEHVFRKDD